MAAPNVNDRLHLTGVHQKPPASFKFFIIRSKKLNVYCFHHVFREDQARTLLDVVVTRGPNVS